MPPWGWTAVQILIIGGGLYRLATTIGSHVTLTQSRELIDLGPTSERLRSVLTLGIVFFGLFQRPPDWRTLAGLSVIVSTLAIGTWVVHRAFLRQRVCEDGISIYRGFFKWNDIQQYTFSEDGTLVINPQKQKATCQIPADRMADLEAVLQQMCPAKS